MTRLTILIAVFLCPLSAATAALSPHADFSPTGNDRLPAASAARFDVDKEKSDRAAGEAPRKPSLEITDKTEVRLDGRPCKFEDVPGTAVVTAIDVAADGKTVVKLHFKSKPAPEAGR